MPAASAPAIDIAGSPIRRVAVTGATGFVGGAVARALAVRGLEVVALARPTSDCSRLAGLDLRWHMADVTERDSLAGAFAGVDAVVHAAGMLGEPLVPEVRYHELHVLGTKNVLAEAVASGRPRVLYISSPGVLGPISGPPAAEDTHYAPSNAYERSKAAAERLALSFSGYHLPLVVARPEFIYGPGDRHVLGLFRAVKRGRFFYVGSGSGTCHPTFIEDAVDGMLRALFFGRPGEIYHIAGLRPVTFRRLVRTIAYALGVGAPRLALPRPVAMLAASGFERLARLSGRRPPLTRTAVAFFSESRRFSWQKARKQLGYVPRVGLDEGAARAVAWYREQGLL